MNPTTTSILYFGLTLPPILFQIPYLNYLNTYYIYGGICLYLITLLFIICTFLNGFDKQIAEKSLMLGCVFTSGLHVSFLAPESYSIFGWYMCILSFFHYSEFVTISICNPNTLSIDSFILNHSLDYKIAAVASWIEFFIERWFYPDFKMARFIPYVGLLMCILGEILRKMAMITASTNFTHKIVTYKNKKHRLVTNGIYKFFRHPSYVGWFYWSIGTQMILANPLCFVGYLLASWVFFNERIFHEEFSLIQFFESEYIEYMKKVPTGLPFIAGFPIEDAKIIVPSKFEEEE